MRRSVGGVEGNYTADKSRDDKRGNGPVQDHLPEGRSIDNA